jgi:hypothetical protein
VEWNLEKLSQAFIPFLDESQVVQVTRELQNLGQGAAMKLRQGRVLFMGVSVLHHSYMTCLLNILTSMVCCWVATNKAMLSHQKEDMFGCWRDRTYWRLKRISFSFGV